jgi:hypothetical protein
MRKNIVKVYNKNEAPSGAVLLVDGIERNGIFDIKVQGYEVLGLNERKVYFYYIPLELDTNNKCWV